MICIGIDPGTDTGVAVWDTREKRFLSLATMPIHRALALVYDYHLHNDTEVVFEDARLRKWFGYGDTSAKAQGAGSVKRDCSIWEDFCKDFGIHYRLGNPGDCPTIVEKSYFEMISGWKGRTSEHSRDAAMLVIGR